MHPLLRWVCHQLAQCFRPWSKSLNLVHNLESLSRGHLRLASVSSLADWQRYVRRSRPGTCGNHCKKVERSPVGVLPIHQTTSAILPSSQLCPVKILAALLGIVGTPQCDSDSPPVDCWRVPGPSNNLPTGIVGGHLALLTIPGRDCWRSPGPSNSPLASWKQSP